MEKLTTLELETIQKGLDCLLKVHTDKIAELRKYGLQVIFSEAEITRQFEHLKTKVSKFVRIEPILKR